MVVHSIADASAFLARFPTIGFVGASSRIPIRTLHTRRNEISGRRGHHTCGLPASAATMMVLLSVLNMSATRE